MSCADIPNKMKKSYKEYDSRRRTLRRQCLKQTTDLDKVLFPYYLSNNILVRLLWNCVTRRDHL